ncbi:MAG: cupin domain-containing protein [Desulfobacterales bacterium]
MGKQVISVADIEEAAGQGNRTLTIRFGECIVTPGARDRARELGVTLLEEESATASTAALASSATSLPAEAEALVGEVCRKLGERLPAGIDPAELEALVRGVVAARLGAGGVPAASPVPAARGVCFIRGARLLAEAAGPVPIAEKAIVAEALCAGEGVKLAGGFMEWENASFHRRVETAEIEVVLEGELRLIVENERIEARAGDMLYLAPGTEVAYEAAGRVRIACVNGLRSS